MDRKPGEKTLITSLIFGIPGPLAVGLGFLFGRTSTQLADFFRRSVELGAIIISFAQYRILYREGEPDPERKARAESITNRSVGAAMILSGLVMLIFALVTPAREKGNVLPGLVVSALGALTNIVF